jgi:hypothetical protein
MEQQQQQQLSEQWRQQQQLLWDQLRQQQQLMLVVMVNAAFKRYMPPNLITNCSSIAQTSCKASLLTT